MHRGLLGAAMVSVCLAACSRTGVDASGRHAWTQPGVLRVAIANEPRNLNPLLITEQGGGFIDTLMFEPLLAANPKGETVPMLASPVPTQANGGISRNGLTIVYHLRRGLHWTDGVPITSGDVKFSWEALMNPRNNVVSRNGYDDVRSIDTPDARTVIVHLRAPFGPFVNTFFADSDTGYNVAPAHVLAKYASINEIPFNAAPTVSDGPFRFVSWTRGDRIELTANDGFFMGRPGLRHITIEMVPNENTAVNLLQSHAVDYLFAPSIDAYPALRSLPYAKIVWVNMNGFQAIEFNLSRPGISNPLVRRAIAYAIDKRAFVAQLTHGQSTIATEDIPNWMWAYDPSVRAVPHDLRKARALMAQAGNPHLHLVLATDNMLTVHRDEAVLVQAALRRIGINVEIKNYPLDVLYEPAAMGGILQGGKFDLSLAPWYAGVDPDDSSEFLCSQVPPNGFNTERYCSAEMDAAQHAALSHYDIPTRKRAYARIESLLARDNPYVFLWWMRQQEAISVDFHGFSPNPANEAWDAWRWRI